MIIHLLNQHCLALIKTLLLPTRVSLLLDSTRHPMWGDHHLISGVGTNPHSNSVGDYHHSSGVFPLNRYKVREIDNKHETSYQLSVAEDRRQKKTKNTNDEFNDSNNDDEFTQVDIDAAIAASLKCSAKRDHDNNDLNVSQRVMSDVRWLDPNAPPSTPPSTPPTTASSTKKKKKKTTKNKKKKKKSGYVGSMSLRGATADEENEMITHGELL
jgi:hypothetical protein